MRFWDTSALVPLVIPQPLRSRVEPLYREDTDVVLWWGTSVECASAVARLAREEAFGAQELFWIRTTFDELGASAAEIQPVESVRLRAKRLLAGHPLRAADALQLSAALHWCRERTEHAAFVCLDGRLREAASREGFRVLPEDLERSP